MPQIRILLLLYVIGWVFFPAKASPAADDPDYLFRLQLDEMVLSEDIAAYGRGEDVFLPLCELSSLTSLAIRMEGDGRAAGFILEESRPFALNVRAGTVNIAGKVFPFDPKHVMARDGDVYVAAELLSRWLPFDLRVNLQEQVVTIVARELLPLQLRMQRKVQPRANLAASLNNDHGFPESSAAYRFFTPPFADFSVLMDIAGENGMDAKGGEVRYSLLASGDLAWMTGSLFAAATGDDLDRFDLSFGRVSPEGNLLGPLHATVFRIGAVQLPALRGVSRVTAPLYGFLLTNRPPAASSRFATHDIQGQLPTGWDAELYYNGIPAGYRPPSEDGTYRFDALPLQYGFNDFRVILHGPHGEIRESRQRFLLDGVMVRPGKAVYTCGVNKGVFAETNSRTGLLTVDLGLTNRISAFAGIGAWGDEYNNIRSYGAIGVRGTAGSSFSALDYVRAEDGGSALFLTLTSHAIPGVFLFLDQALLSRFVSEVFPYEHNPFTSRTQLRLEGSIPFEKRFPYSIEAVVGRRQDGEVVPGGAFRVTGGSAGVSVTSQLAVRHEYGQADVTGLMQVGTSLRDLSIRGQASFSIVPSPKIETLQLAGSKALGTGYQILGGVNHEPEEGKCGLTVGFSKRTGAYSFALSAGWDFPGSYKVSAQFSFGFGLDPVTASPLLEASPLASSGAARVFAFADTNGNGRNDGEPVLKNIKFSLDGAVLPDRTGEDGVMTIRHLQPGAAIDLGVVGESAEDPYISPAVAGYRFTPRPGVMGVYDFPFVPSGEVDGIVRIAGGNEEAPVAEVCLILVDPDGRERGRTRSDPSGYYLFKGVRAGSYRVILAKGEEARLGAGQKSPLEVKMPQGGDLIGGIDVLLAPLPTPTFHPSTEG